MDSTELLLIGLLLVTALVMWGVFLARAGKAGKPAVLLGIPRAMRPAEADEKLEGPRLTRIMSWGVIATMATAVFIPAYWLGELQRQQAFVDRFDEQSLERGALIFAVPPELPEESDPQAFREAEHALALGMGCANCHGGVDEEDPANSALGGQVPGGFVDPASGKTVAYQAPPLQNVFQRWDEEVVRFTIERGRPGTPMPTWGVAYGGPMTSLMVDDVINWLRSLPGNQEAPEPVSQECKNPAKSDYMSCGEEIFTARCTVCHGPQGQGKEGVPAEGEDQPLWYPGLALWKGDVRHLDRKQHITTVSNGRRFGFMPAWAEAPTQGIPVPPYPLTDKQIEAVVTYERSL
jgi:mono/diheme cytochrome c family protein